VFENPAYVAARKNSRRWEKTMTHNTSFNIILNYFKFIFMLNYFNRNQLRFL
jgi:hypothetical protein